MKKRLLSLALVLVMLLSMVPFGMMAVSATDTETVWVGGVPMYDGDYLANSATETQTTQPSGGYAYYKDGVLTLNNYEYEGAGYKYNSFGNDYYYTVIYADQDLEILLVGENNIIQTEEYSESIYVRNGRLMISGTGALESVSDYGITCYDDVIINGGDIIITTNYAYGISSDYLTITGGKITINSNSGGINCEQLLKITGGVININSSGDGIVANYDEIQIKGGEIVIVAKKDGIETHSDISITGGKLDITAYFDGINSYGCTYINGGLIDIKSTIAFDIDDEDYCAINSNLVIGENLAVQASTEHNGVLGEYIAENIETYDRIVFVTVAASNINVNCIGDIDYTVREQTVTVDHDVACRVGYLDGESYVAITATDNGDGTYSYTAPEGVAEVILVVKGDVNGDGAVDKKDYAALKRFCFNTMVLDSEALFAAEINNDGAIDKKDYAALKRACFGTMVIAP